MLLETEALILSTLSEEFSFTALRQRGIGNGSRTQNPRLEIIRSAFSSGGLRSSTVQEYCFQCSETYRPSHRARRRATAGPSPLRAKLRASSGGTARRRHLAALLRIHRRRYGAPSITAACPHGCGRAGAGVPRPRRRVTAPF